MSRPANSLAAFRSYSYYHVLCMCDSTDTADALATSTDLSIWDHATPTNRVGEDDLGRYSPKCINGSGKYVVLINGSSNATYVITQAKWTTATAGQAVPGDRGNSLAVEGSMQISEPKGVAFLDQIVKCSIALGVDASQVVYVLKTFFVGHLDDHSPTYANVISDIPPVNCIVYDVTGSFTNEGGIYEMNFVAVAHGASRLPQYSSVPSAITFTAGTSLQDTLQRLQDNVNGQYDSYFKGVLDEVAAARGISASEAAALLRPVKYVIEVGDDYKDARYTVTDQPTQYKNSTGCDSPAQLSFPQGVSIESAIRTIMQTSLQVKEEMAAVDKKYEYKIHTTIQSKPANSGGECTTNSVFDYTVYYRVERLLSPKSTDAFEVLARNKTQTELSDDPDFAKIKNNIIEFDYIYTGKNIDILEFDMKVNLGLAFLQIASQANTFKNQTDRAATKVTKASTEDVNKMTHRFSGDPVQIPIFFGTTVKQPGLQNTQNATTTLDSAYTLAKHASIEMAEATMRIVGNDQLLSMCNRSTSSRFVIEGSKRVFNEETQVEEPFNQWSNTPTFAKVNIKMPRNNDDFSLFTGADANKSADYAEDFWFDGYYYVYGIDHVFDQGDFSQTLQMFALPRKGTNPTAQTRDVKKPVAPTYENQIPTPPAGGGRGFVHPPFVRPNEDGSPTNREDAQSSTKNKDLSSVPGWNEASPAVKQAIQSAADRYGVSPVTLATIVSKESNFNASAKAPTSSATGLGQFIDSTWLAQVRKDTSIGVDSGAPKSVQLAARTNPVYNANATASYVRDNVQTTGSSEVGDIYLAHFSGPGIAREVVRLDRAGHGHTPLRQAYVNAMGQKKGNSAFEAVKKANPSIVNESTTVAQQRAWAAKKMGLTPPSKNKTTTSAASAPASPPSVETRKANEAVGATIDAKAQDSKKDIQPCGNSVDRRGK